MLGYIILKRNIYKTNTNINISYYGLARVPRRLRSTPAWPRWAAYYYCYYYYDYYV